MAWSPPLPNDRGYLHMNKEKVILEDFQVHLTCDYEEYSE